MFIFCDSMKIFQSLFIILCDNAVAFIISLSEPKLSGDEICLALQSIVYDYSIAFIDSECHALSDMSFLLKSQVMLSKSKIRECQRCRSLTFIINIYCRFLRI